MDYLTNSDIHSGNELQDLILNYKFNVGFR